MGAAIGIILGKYTLFKGEIRIRKLQLYSTATILPILPENSLLTGYVYLIALHLFCIYCLAQSAYELTYSE